MRTWVASGTDALEQIASELLDYTEGCRLLLFHGQPGAGKTTFIKALCRKLGVTDLVNSPTFALVHEYEAAGNVIYHLDLYRVRSVNELYDIGIEQYLDADGYCMIEWPEMLDGLFNQRKADIFITIENGNRVMTCVYE